ncbi:MAG: T9SS type A sorting domain-containing protein [Melioribacteraceae bacterium]|nr:T9SS type A sorting domain-containing protein [Melioribacteraceae bacterium]MCF8354262.1 T9SS type A sorting domain-containing protein [Melioribacteraceae bacterium]MCF8396259.1 T9SS type A sorting domain-containing protein [Melioribacteraceae bacterium]MCF8419725.1 T9SS type A sorting domain-containing protein [Melioribacteraceae bacterium]
MSYSKMILILLTIFLSGELKAQVIYSTTVGGNWEHQTTWIGEDVPTSTDSVVIQGPVILNFDVPTIRNLYVTADGSLEDGWNSTIKITENVIMDGPLNSTAGANFEIEIGGDLTINADWTGDLTFTGTADHHLSTAPGVIFDPYNHIFAFESRVVATSDIYITANAFPNLVVTEFDISGGYDLYVKNVRIGSDYYFTNEGIRTKITGGGNSIHMSGNTPYYERCDLYNVNFTGYSIIGLDVDFYGEMVNTDTLVANHYRYVDVNGNFTNNGKILINSGYRVSLNLWNDFVNNGICEVDDINFLGTDDHYVTTSGENWIHFFSEFNAMESKVIAASDLYLMANLNYLVAADIDLSGGYNLYLNNLRLGWTSADIKTKITGAGNSIFMSGGINSFYEYCELYDVYLRGLSVIGADVDFYGEVTNIDTIYANHERYVDVFGNFTNSGEIMMQNGYRVSFNIYNDFVNDGLCQVNTLNFMGTNDHNLSTLNGNWIDFYPGFNALESNVIAASDLYLKSSLNNIVAQNIDLSNGYDLYLENVRVGSNIADITTKITGGGNAIHMSGDFFQSFYLRCNLYDVVLKGYSVVNGTGTSFYGEVINADTLTNMGNSSVNSYGNFTNHGLIYPSSYDINFFVYGDLINDGNYGAALTKLVGTEDQKILLPAGTYSSFSTVFESELTGTEYQWQKDGTDIDGETTNQLTINTGLSEDNFGMYQCIVDGASSRKIYVGQSTPPPFEIYDVEMTNISETDTQIDWKTTVPANGFIFYAENDTSSGFPFEAMEPEGFVLEHSLTLDNLTTGSTYYFIIDQNDEDWNWVRSGTYMFVAGDSIVSVSNDAVISNYLLYQNYPNPFNPSSIISFDLPEDSKVEIIVFNAIGEKVGEILNESLGTGHHNVKFDASNLSSGIYYYKIRANDFIDVKKMVLIK